MVIQLKIRLRSRLLSVTLLLCAQMANAMWASAADNSLTRPSIANLPGVYILVESFPENIENLGLTRDEVRLGIQRKIESAGIPVLTREEVVSMVGTPYLYVNTHILMAEKFVYSISVELKQSVYLARLPQETVDATTWSKRYLGISSSLDDVKSRIMDMIDIFIYATRPKAAIQP